MQHGAAGLLLQPCGGPSAGRGCSVRLNGTSVPPDRSAQVRVHGHGRPRRPVGRSGVHPSDPSVDPAQRDRNSLGRTAEKAPQTHGPPRRAEPARVSDQNRPFSFGRGGNRPRKTIDCLGVGMPSGNESRSASRTAAGTAQKGRSAPAPDDERKPEGPTELHGASWKYIIQALHPGILSREVHRLCRWDDLLRHAFALSRPLGLGFAARSDGTDPVHDPNNDADRGGCR